MTADIATIFVNVLLPVLVIAALGAVVERCWRLNISTLSTLNLYLFVPVFLFQRVSHSELGWTDIGRVGLVVMIPMIGLGLITYGLLRATRASGATIATTTVGGLFFNAGNFGIPVAVLAFGDAGGGVQALIVLFMNLSTFLFGYSILVLAQGQGARAMLGFFRMPMLYVTVAALLVRDLQIAVPTWLDTGLESIASGMVAVALVTLGAQLATRFRWPKWRLIGPVMILKLIISPLATAAVVWALDLWPWPGAQLILAAAGPTAVNTLLLTLELEGDAKAAADCVFWTTIGSAITVAVVLMLLRVIGGDALPVPI